MRTLTATIRNKWALAAWLAMPLIAWSMDLDRSVNFHIQAQALSAALIEFSRQSNVQVIVADDLTGVTTQGVIGRKPVKEALSKLLEPAGLRYRVAGDTAINVGRVPVTDARNRKLEYPLIVVAQSTGTRGNSLAEPRGPGQGGTTPVEDRSDTSADDERGGGSLQEVVVTGTRIDAQGYTAPTPVRTIDSSFMEQRIPADMGELMKEIPGVTVSGPSNSSANTVSQAYVGLRFNDVGSKYRTLVLVDGERTIPTGTTGAFDINTIPTVMVDRTEIVTGGASAAYGSDAVAGVANFVLKSRLDGFSGSVSYGQAEHGGNEVRSVGLGFGTDLGSRTHLMVAMDASDNDGITSNYSRDWFKQEGGVFSLGAAAVGGGGVRAGRPAQIWTTGVEQANNTPGGIITACARAGVTAACPASLTNIAFSGAGSPYTIVKGTQVGSFMYGTDANYGDTNSSYTYLSAPYTRRTGFGRLTFDVTDNTSVWLQVWGAHNTATSIQNILQSSTTVTTSNPFLPASVLQAMNAAGITSFTLGRTNTDLGPYVTAQTDDFLNLSLHASGKVFDDWKWHANYQRAATRFDGTATGIRTADVNAAFNATTINGVAACSTVAGASPGCVPFNVFGVGNESAAAQAYVRGYLQGFRVNYTQDAAEASVSGEAGKTWAGPLAWAAGADWRQEDISQVTTEDSRDYLSYNSVVGGYGSTGFTFSNYPEYQAGRHVIEGFAELDAPLARDLHAVKALDLNVAYRHASYSDDGPANVWKVGLTWALNDEYRVRATRSRDFRAPNLFEQYALTGSTTIVFANPVTGVSDTNVLSFKGVNADLRPEQSNTTTAGFAIQPHWAPGLRFAADYWNIDVLKAIYSAAMTTVVTQCLVNHLADYCKGLTFSATNPQQLTVYKLLYLNAAELQINGFDLDLAYRLPTRIFGGSLSGSLQFTRVNHYATIDATGETVQRTQPRNKGTLLLVYNRGPITTSLEFIGQDHFKYSAGSFGPDDPSYYQPVTSANCPGGTAAAPTQCALYQIASNSISDNWLPGLVYINWSMQYDFALQSNRKLQVFAGVNNLTDRDAGPFTNIVAGVYDVIGRSYRAGLRFAF